MSASTRRKPLSWTEPAPGLFRAVGYAIEYDHAEHCWQVMRLWETKWYSMGIQSTLKEAMQSCTRHRRVNRP